MIESEFCVEFLIKPVNLWTNLRWVDKVFKNLNFSWHSKHWYTDPDFNFSIPFQSNLRWPRVGTSSDNSSIVKSRSVSSVMFCSGNKEWFQLINKWLFISNLNIFQSFIILMRIWFDLFKTFSLTFKLFQITD
jgi:hypothetical protein